MAQLGLGTRCVQAGYDPKNGEPRQIPIIQSTTFKYESSEQMGKLFDLEASGYFYSRLQNPTNDAVAARIAALEGGTAAMLTSSGQAAIFFAVFNIVGAGDHLVSSSSIYGGSFNLFAVTMKRMGVEVTFVDPDCSPEELDAAFHPNTKAMYGETIANPALTVLDIEKFAAAAHRHGVPLIVDNTFATPINCRPFEWGADIVVHSTTKYMDGHAGAIGGAIVDSGRFDWTRYPDKYPGLCEPDESYHGVTYTERFGLAGAYITKATVQLMRGFDDTFMVPHSRHTTVLREDIERCGKLKILASSEQAGVYAASTAGGRQIFITGHSEYDARTLEAEYRRDKAAGLPIHMPENYYPNNDDTQPPMVTWRSHASLLYQNWLNYFVYQTTPYDISNIRPIPTTEDL